MLPDGDGFDLLAKMRRHPIYAMLPIVMLTAKSDPDDIRRGLGLGRGRLYHQAVQQEHSCGDDPARAQAVRVTVFPQSAWRKEATRGMSYTSCAKQGVAHGKAESRKAWPFKQMKPAEKVVFILKLAVCILTFGIVFPNVMSD